MSDEGILTLILTYFHFSSADGRSELSIPTFSFCWKHTFTFNYKIITWYRVFFRPGGTLNYWNKTIKLCRFSV